MLQASCYKEIKAVNTTSEIQGHNGAIQLLNRMATVNMPGLILNITAVTLTHATVISMLTTPPPQIIEEKNLATCSCQCQDRLLLGSCSPVILAGKNAVRAVEAPHACHVDIASKDGNTCRLG